MKLKQPLFALLFAALLPLAAHADLPGKHPAYLHALSDLRDARWKLEHRPGDAAVSGQEDVAITEVDKAIGEIKKAAIDDGKNLNDHPHEDAAMDHPGRLHHALELLKKAESDVSGEEDNPETRELKHRVMDHIHAAIHATEHAIHDVETHK
ncbi:hypothetical protein [Solimicrobium silvestre]|uniref:Small metal-binding protein n=1 Tax=Solimicrobium silvestre TaxID=2099400 RepID=A0A2S9H0S6_9BURK|nr:hypothetical protein [Solimicrobium silvestre]PRC93567.1 hypothetical protein S2091_1568 [Solimicrobium silvestre]